MSRTVLLTSSAIGAVASAMVPLGALFLLDVSDFGAFSLCYLVFAWGWSIELSTICDTWARERAHRPSMSWPKYASALTQLSLAGAIVAIGLGIPTYGSVAPALLTAVATAAAMYRLGGRFHHAATSRSRSVLLSDTVSVLIFAGLVWVLAGTGIASRLDSLLIAWASSGLLSCLFFPAPGMMRAGGLRDWYHLHQRTIRPLLGESLMMDAGSIGTPMIMSPLLGLSNFGIYRSVSSVSLPVQLIIDPIRPNLSQMPATTLLGRTAALVVLGGAALLGSGAFGVLVLLAPVLSAVSPVLGELGAHALACGIFVSVAFTGYYLYIAARAHVRHENLIRGRAVQTLFAIASPLTGLLLGGLPGAIWGFVAANTATPLIWLFLLRRESGARGVKRTQSHVGSEH